MSVGCKTLLSWRLLFLFLDSFLTNALLGAAVYARAARK
jgi:hypothetical protein